MGSSVYLKSSNLCFLLVVNWGDARKMSEGLPYSQNQDPIQLATKSLARQWAVFRLGLLGTPTLGVAGGLRERRLWSGWLLLWGLAPGSSLWICCSLLAMISGLGRRPGGKQVEISKAASMHYVSLSTDCFLPETLPGGLTRQCKYGTLEVWAA